MSDFASRLTWLIGGLMFGAAVAALIIAIAPRKACAEVLPERPVVNEKLPSAPVKARKADCRVSIGRGLLFIRLEDGRVVPLAVLMSRRTMC